MSHFLSKDGLFAVQSLAAPGTLYCFDFDGTLAPIVLEPAQARMSPEIETLLGSLKAFAPVAVLSGRSVADLRSRIPFELDYVVGNHGMEGLPGTRPVAKVLEMCARWKLRLEELLRPLMEPGIWIEDKGLSLSIHYRRASDPERIANDIRERLESLNEGSRVVPGKQVFNLVPKKAVNKGVALLRLLERARVQRALFIGDDDTDEDVFALQDPRIVGLRVGSSRSSKAQFYLNSQAEVREVLRAVLTRYSAGV